jgi:hypothetical protein
MTKCSAQPARRGREGDQLVLARLQFEPIALADEPMLPKARERMCDITVELGWLGNEWLRVVSLPGADAVAAIPNPHRLCPAVDDLQHAHLIAM